MSQLLEQYPRVARNYLQRRSSRQNLETIQQARRRLSVNYGVISVRFVYERCGLLQSNLESPDLAMNKNEQRSYKIHGSELGSYPDRNWWEL